MVPDTHALEGGGGGGGVLGLEVGEGLQVGEGLVLKI